MACPTDIIETAHKFHIREMTKITKVTQIRRMTEKTDIINLQIHLGTVCMAEHIFPPQPRVRVRIRFQIWAMKQALFWHDFLLQRVNKLSRRFKDATTRHDQRTMFPLFSIKSLCTTSFSKDTM